MAATTLTFTYDDPAAWADGVAEDGDGGSINLSWIDVQLLNISDMTGTAVGQIDWRDNSWLYSNDNSYSGLTFDDANNGGTKGMAISSADGTEFSLKSFMYYNWGETESATITVVGYRDGFQVADHSFEAYDPSWTPMQVNLDLMFSDVDEVRLYISGGGYLGDQSATHHSMNDIVIAEAVVPNDAPTATNLTQSRATIEGGLAVALDDIVVSDLNTGDTVTATLTLSSAAAGTLSTGTFGSATSTFNAGTGVWTVTGSVADVNSALAAVAVTPAANSDQNFTITTRIRDAADAGPADGTISVIVTAVNDAPQVSTPLSIPITEDVAAALSGLSFSDVDAGSSAVTVELSVGSGSLSAASGSGVSVSGSGSGVLSLGGTLADINTFISAGDVTFTTGLNATADVQLTASINDGGNTGTGGPLSNSATITLDVTAVNDAPVVSVPANLAVTSGTPTALTGISFSDVDAGSGSVTATLSVPSGSLAALGGGGVTVGGTASALTLNGALADINAFIAASNVIYLAAAGSLADVTLTASVTDNGYAGSGGALSDTDIVLLSVEAAAPLVSSVSSSTANGTYKAGDTLTLTVTFDQAVLVGTAGGTPGLVIETGTVDRVATYQSGSGTNTLTFSYTVQVGDLSGDLDYASINALNLNGGTIRNAEGDDATLALATPGTAGSLGANNAIVVDGVAPDVIATSAAFSADSGISATDLITNSASQTLSGSLSTPLAAGEFVEVSINNGVSWATATASGSAWSLAGITLAGSGTLQVRVSDLAGNHGEVWSRAYKLDTGGPTTATLSVDDSTLTAGETATLTIVFSEPVVSFTVQDLIVGTGTVSGLSSADQITWTATLTPAANTSVDGNTISLDLAAIADVAGNIGSGVVDSNAYDVRTDTPPGPGPDPEPPQQPNTPAGDLLQGTSGDDNVDGLAGVDVFRIAANRADVEIIRNADGTITISHPDFGTDTLANVELLRFEDQVEIINPPTGQVSEPGSTSFTEAGYLAQNPDVAEAVASGLFSSGLEHYNLYGAAEGRSLPKVAVDESFYLSQNDDVADAVERGEFSSALEHYLRYGANEGRSPNVLFDEAWYLTQYPDVSNAIDSGTVTSAYEHFQMYGWKEGRDPSAWMDISDYLAGNEDVAASGVNPLDHFLDHGIHEGRTIQADDSGLWLM